MQTNQNSLLRNFYQEMRDGLCMEIASAVTLNLKHRIRKNERTIV